MVRFLLLSISYLASAIFASPVADLQGRGDCNVNGVTSKASACLNSAGPISASSFCSSFLGVQTVTMTKSKDGTITTTVTTEIVTAATVTTTSTSTSTTLTCPTAHFTFGANVKAKRQASNPESSCVASYGSVAVSAACQKCYATTTPKTTTTTTMTSTIMVSGTTTFTPPTSGATAVSVVASPSPTPSTFYVYYVDSTSSTRYASVVPAPEGTPRVITFPTGTPGTPFARDNALALFKKQDEDIFPWLYLDSMCPPHLWSSAPRAGTSLAINAPRPTMCLHCATVIWRLGSLLILRVKRAARLSHSPLKMLP